MVLRSTVSLLEAASLLFMCVKRFSGTKHDDLDLPSCNVDIAIFLLCVSVLQYNL